MRNLIFGEPAILSPQAPYSWSRLPPTLPLVKEISLHFQPAGLLCTLKKLIHRVGQLSAHPNSRFHFEKNTLKANFASFICFLPLISEFWPLNKDKHFTQKFYTSGHMYGLVESHFNRGLYPLPTFAQKQIGKKSPPKKSLFSDLRVLPSFKGWKAGGMDWSGFSWDG